MTTSGNIWVLYWSGICTPYSRLCTHLHSNVIICIIYFLKLSRPIIQKRLLVSRKTWKHHARMNWTFAKRKTKTGSHFCINTWTTAPYPIFAFSWAQVQRKYLSLSEVMYNIHPAPFSTVGIKSNRKINKRVMNQLRCCMAESKVEIQVCIKHNIDQLNLETDSKFLAVEVHLARQDDLSTSRCESGGTGIWSALDSNEAVDRQC